MLRQDREKTPREAQYEHRAWLQELARSSLTVASTGETSLILPNMAGGGTILFDPTKPWDRSLIVEMRGPQEQVSTRPVTSQDLSLLIQVVNVSNRLEYLDTLKMHTALRLTKMEADIQTARRILRGRPI